MRPKTGLKRPYPVQVDLSKEQDEFIARASYQAKISKAEFVRHAVFVVSHPGWFKSIPIYRKKQKGKNVWKLRTGRKTGTN